MWQGMLMWHLRLYDTGVFVQFFLCVSMFCLFAFYANGKCKHMLWDLIKVLKTNQIRFMQRTEKVWPWQLFICVSIWGMLASSVTGKHTNYNTYKAALDSMVKLILLQCLEMCLPLHAVTLIQLRESRHGYKMSVF